MHMEHVATLRKDPTALIARGLSLAAMLICVAAFAAILVEGAAKAPAVAAGGGQMAQLDAASARLASELGRLAPGMSAADARRALHAAQVRTAAITSDLKRAEAAGLPADARLADAVEAQKTYLAAARAALASPQDGWQRAAALAAGPRG